MTATDRLFEGSALRYLAVLAAAALTFTLLPLAGVASGQVDEDRECDDAPFTDREDIPTAHRENVDCAFQEGIVQGFTDNTYRPALDVRRDQMATFIEGTLEAAGVDLPEGDSNTFDDVPDGNVHSDAVNSLAEAEIVFGGPGNLPPSQYGPALSTRRDQMTSFLIRAAEFATGNTYGSSTQQFPDVPSGNVHFQSVNGAAETELALGRTDGNFYPSENVRRDQMGSFVIRLLEFLRGELEPTTPEPTPVANRATATAAPELLRVEFVQEQLSPAPGAVALRFVYDSEIRNAPIVAASHLLYSYDGATRTPGTAASRDPNNTAASLVSFPRPQYLLATTATVARNAVQDPSGRFNPEGEWPLKAVTFTAESSGEAPQANLQSIGNFRRLTTDTEDVIVDYTFDRDAVAAGATAGEMNYWLLRQPTGAATAPVYQQGVVESIGGTNNTVVRVRFTGVAPGPTAAERADQTAAFDNQTRRGLVYLNSVADFHQSVDYRGGNTNAPDLVSVRYEEDNNFVFYTFDRVVQEGGLAPGDFWIYFRDGTMVSADAVTRTDTLTVRARFGPADAATANHVHENVAGAWVDDGAVQGQEAPMLDNADQELGRAGTYAAGWSSGPVLTDVNRDVTTDIFGTQQQNRVTFIYDKRVDTVVAGEHAVYSAEGARTAMTTCTRRTATADQHIVDCVSDVGTVTGGAIANATLAGVGHNAVMNHAATARQNQPGVIGNYEASQPV